MKNIACIIMASGLGRRFGENKLLAEFHGEPMICHILKQTEGLFPRRVVVTRYREIEEMCRRQNIDCILHDLPSRNDTVRLGVEFFETKVPKGLSKVKDSGKGEQSEVSVEGYPFYPGEYPFHPKGYLFCPADQPLLTGESLKKMAAAFTQCTEPGTILRLSYEEKAGAPVLFDAVYAEELTRLPEKKGGSYLIRKYPHRVANIMAASAYELMDVDTPKDLQMLNDMPDIL